MKNRRSFLKGIAAAIGAIAAYPLLGSESAPKKKGIAELLEDQARISAQEHMMDLPPIRSLSPPVPRTQPNVGDLMVIKAGVSFWSINIQENVRAGRDIVMRVTNTCYGSDAVFGKAQLVMENLTLAYVCSERNDHRGYIDTNHDISISASLLEPYTAPPNMFAGIMKPFLPPSVQAP